MRINDLQHYNDTKKKITMKNLSKIINSKGYSNVKVGINAKVTSSTIQAYKNNQKIPSLPTLISLADFFSCNLDYLVDRADNPLPISQLDRQDEKQIELLINYNPLSNINKEKVIAYIKGLADAEK